MPKIPTYDIQGRITADVPSTGTIPSISVTENIANAAKPITNFIVNEYVQEKKLEADNKAYQLLSDMYIDQKDANGNIIQEGLFSIQSTTKKNGNPTDAALYHDNSVNSLYNYFKNNKFNTYNENYLFYRLRGTSPKDKKKTRKKASEFQRYQKLKAKFEKEDV